MGVNQKIFCSPRRHQGPDNKSPTGPAENEAAAVGFCCFSRCGKMFVVSICVLLSSLNGKHYVLISQMLCQNMPNHVPEYGYGSIPVNAICRDMNICILSAE